MSLDECFLSSDNLATKYNALYNMLTAFVDAEFVFTLHGLWPQHGSSEPEPLLWVDIFLLEGQPRPSPHLLRWRVEPARPKLNP